MVKKRLIAVLIVRDGAVVQSVKFQHTNVIHYDPIHAVECFSQWAVDELIVLNVSRSPDSGPAFAEVLERICRRCFVPVCAGGWITNDDEARLLLNSGADKLAVNTLYRTNPKMAEALAAKYGSQCIVASIDVRADAAGTVRVWVDRGRENTEMGPVAWARFVESCGAGEILLNSIDHDGNRKGYNLSVLSDVAKGVSIPVIAFGGVFEWRHLAEGLDAGAEAAAVANKLHYIEHSALKAKKYLLSVGQKVRAC